MSRFENLEDLLRRVDLVKIPPRRPGRSRGCLWVVFDLALPGGMKDRSALRLVEDAERSGRLRPGGVIIESSSGSMAEGLARVGGLRGYRVIIVTDPRIDDLMRTRLEALGVELDVVQEYDPAGGWQRSRLRRLRELLDRYPEAVWVRQYDNSGNAAAYEEVARRIYQELGDSVAVFVAAVGSGGSISGTALHLRRFLPQVRVVAVDAVGSVLFHQPDSRRLQSGHSNSIVPGNLRYDLIDEVHWLSDSEVFASCRDLARRLGIFAGGSSGAVYVVASWVSERIEEGRSVVAIFPDRGDRYHKSIYCERFLEEHRLDRQGPADEPVEIRYGREVAERWSRAQLPRDASVRYHAPEARSTEDIAEELGLPTS